MDYHLMQGSASGSLYFRIFYLLAFLIAYGFLLYEGYKRKFPLLTWSLIITCVWLFLIAGTKLFAYSKEEWQFMLENHTLILTTKKTLLGGLLLGFAGYLVGRSWFRFRNNALDAMAVALPFCVAIQKIGCFFAGCCFGNPSTLPWAVKYPVMTLPHYHHFQTGLITQQNLYSLPVHPAQLYFALGGFLVVFAVIKTRNYWKASGSSFLFSIIFYVVVRFLLEFFRDPLSNMGGGIIAGHLKLVQWELLIAAIVLTFILIYREKRKNSARVMFADAQPPVYASILFIFMIVLIFRFLQKWFTPVEFISMNIALIPAMILVVISLINSLTVRQYKWIYSGILIFLVFLMSQTIAQSRLDTTLTKEFLTYNTLSTGFASGDFVNSHTIGQGEGCDRVQNTEYFNQRYAVVGAGFSITRKRLDNKETLHYGMSTYLGRNQQTRLSDEQLSRTPIIGVNPYVMYDMKWMGIGGGIHVGNLVYSKENRNIDGYDKPENGNLYTFIYPQIYFRFGVRKFFYGDFHLADQFPTPSPGLRYQLGIGSGFGSDNGLQFRFGSTFIESYILSSKYLSAYIPINKNFAFEPLYFWGHKPSGYQGLFPPSPQYQFSLALHYNFGHMTIHKKSP